MVQHHAAWQVLQRLAAALVGLEGAVAGEGGRHADVTVTVEVSRRAGPAAGRPRATALPSLAAAALQPQAAAGGWQGALQRPGLLACGVLALVCVAGLLAAGVPRLPRGREDW